MKARADADWPGVSGRRKPLLVVQIVLAIIWSFLGIRKRVHMEEDFERLPLVAVIVAGVIAAALFVFSILFVVRLVVP